MPRGRPRKDALIKSAEMIGWALGGLEREIERTRQRLSALNAEAAKLRARIGKRVTTAAAGEETAGGPAGRRRRRRMSAEARKRISEMMKKRWAERRKKSS